MATVACGPSMMVVRRRSWIGLVVELGYQEVGKGSVPKE